MSSTRPTSTISITARTARIPRGDARAQVPRIAGCLLAVLAATACATQTSDEEPAGAPPTMDAVFSQVLEPRCTFSSCHSSPTVAAKLDLSREHACNALVGAASCLFPQRKLVVPSNPDDSFLMHKLTGTALAESPDGNCSVQSNAPMPFGGSAIPDEEIALIRDWIATGAPCESSPIGGPGTPPGTRLVTSLTVDRTAPFAGEIVTVTVTLDGLAADGGQPIDLETDTRALSAPVQVFVPAGKSQVTFEAYAQRPTPLFALVAHSGDSAKTALLRVTGLEVAEVLSNAGHGDRSQWVKLRNRSTLPIDLTGYRLQAGLSSYGLLTVPLAGTLAPGSCVVLGELTGPTPTGAVTYQPVTFSPDLPTGGSQAAGYAVFDSGAVPVSGIRSPLDTMLVGAGNAAKLLGVDGLAAAPACPTPPPGYSARRTGPTTCVASVPQPTQCP